MVIKSEVMEVIDEFNKSGRGTKAKLLGSGIDFVRVLFSGALNKKDEDNEFPAFRELLEAKLKQPVGIKESIRIDDESHRIAYSIGGEDPADTILKVLHKYEEGTPKRKEGFED